MSNEARYVPAAGIDALTGVYDVGVRLTMREGRWRRLIVDEIAAVEPRIVVDVGCGTGTLTIAAADELRESRVVGLDGDRKVLDLARRKDGSERVEWVEGLADELPFGDGEVDALMTTLRVPPSAAGHQAGCAGRGSTGACVPAGCSSWATGAGPRTR